MVDFPTITFIVVSDLFERYTIIVNTASKTTSVYCEECREWVGEWEGDQISQHSTSELEELIVSEHELQVRGHPISFNEPKPLSIGRE